MLTLAMLVGLVVTLLVVAMAMPKRKPASTGPTRDDPPASQLSYTSPHAPLPTLATAVDHRTLRQRQIDEDAALLSGEFARFEDDRYRAEVRDRAARAFGPASVPAAAIPAQAPAPRPAATV